MLLENKMKNNDEVFELSIESAVMLLRWGWQTTNRYFQEIHWCLDFLAKDSNNHSTEGELISALHDYVWIELLKAWILRTLLNQASLKRNIIMKNGQIKHPFTAFRSFSDAPKVLLITRSYFHLNPLLWEAISDEARMRPWYARIPRKRRNNLKWGNIIDDDDSI